MTPGRALDALVAEKVMGIKPGPEFHWNFDSHTKITGGIPCYSTDIAAAWEVAQKIKDQNGEDTNFVIHLSDSKFEECEIEFTYWVNEDGEPILAGPYFVLGKTAPHAISLAALKAVGHEF